MAEKVKAKKTVKKTSTKTNKTKINKTNKKVKKVNKTDDIAQQPENLLLSNYVPKKKNEEYMNANQRDHFREKLNSWLQDLLKGAGSTIDHMKNEAANFPDAVDRAQQEGEFSIELRTRDRERKLIRKIEEALDRIENEDYGFCELCGEEIGLGRLDARPTATLCIECKTLSEIRERQQGN